MTPGARSIAPRHGQFIVVYITARNDSNAPATFHIGEAELVDANGKHYSVDVDELEQVSPIGDDGFDDDQQPGVTTHGWIPFDVPASVTGASAVSLLPDDSGDAPPTIVRLHT